MPKKFSFRGLSLEELQKLSIDEFAKLLASRERRALRRGLTEQQKKLLENIRKNHEKFHKTHQRDMVVLPEMANTKIGIYVGGKKGEEGGKWASVIILPDMVGHRLGEFALTAKRVKHSAPGIGATRGSKHIPMK